ncbi:MAG: prephenate dehydratase [Gammaproteobacteria bacterium]|nr:prephenate dehydratase [Gammaproteobacteria bacterium]
MDDRLKQLRERIDGLDEKILELISERAACAQEVALVKQESGSSAYYRPEREAQVLRRILKNNNGPLADEEMARLFREIMSACLALESRQLIAFLGPEGTYTQEAALKHFGHSVRTLPLNAIDEVFREVEAGTTPFGVVPIENSTEGVVSHTLDSFMGSSLYICGEVELRIHHQFLSKSTELSAIKRVVSHRQSLAQCREWLDANLPGIERVAAGTNAEAAMIASSDPEVAAIASESAAQLYKLNILVANIEDEPDNTTRFLIIGKQETEPSGDDKTSLLVSCKNRPGGLADLLMPLSRHKISMTRIESRPSRKGMWEYVFFLDIEGHHRNPKIAAALADLEEQAAFLKLLGSYPKAVL